MRTVYLGRDNTFDLVLQKDNVPVDASLYNRFVLYMRDKKPGGTTITIDSQTAGAGVFVTTNSTYFQHKNVAVLRCKIGLGSFGLVGGRIYECWLRVYSVDFPNGIVWPDNEDVFRVRVDTGP